MRVIPKMPAVTFIDGQYVPLQPGSEIDIPEELAQRLIDAGTVSPVESAKAPRRGKPGPTETK